MWMYLKSEKVFAGVIDHIFAAKLCFSVCFAEQYPEFYGH